MKDNGDIKYKKAILSTVSLQFSPKIQPIKESAIDKIIEQILLYSKNKEGMKIQQIQDALYSESGRYYRIGRSVIEKSLIRLAEKLRIVKDSQKYKLSSDTKSKLIAIHQEAEKRFRSVVDHLFKNTGEGSSTYIAPFLKFLCTVFSDLGEQSVRLIKEDISKNEFLKSPSIPSIVAKLKREFPSINHSIFEGAVVSFFRKSNPKYDAIKWNMAQNYYIIKALGLDPDGLSLSNEVFGDSNFYLDTNIVISAIEPRERYHKSFLTLCRACKELNIKLKVCQITIDEFRGWLSHQQDLLEKVADEIPDEIAPNISSVLYEIYRDKKSSGKGFDLDDIFSSFSNPMTILKEHFEVELIDDNWFIESKENQDIIDFSQFLISKYKDLTKRDKGKKAAQHDSLLLFWIDKLRKENGSKYWVISADTSFPGSVPKNSNAKSLAITLDALLQWVSPIVISKGEESEIATVFSEMIKYRLLPQETIFSLEDFLMFHDTHMSCKELPAKDVEDCIRYIKANAPTLDPSNPDDREILHYEISKFLLQPGRKYKQEISRLENEIEKIKKATSLKIGEISVREREKELKYKTQFEKQLDTIKTLVGKIKNIRRESLLVTLRSSANRRLRFVSVLFLAFEVIALYLSSKYGFGENFFQKIMNSWHLWGVIVPVLSIAIGWIVIGRERIRVFAWAIRKILKFG